MLSHRVKLSAEQLADVTELDLDIEYACILLDIIDARAAYEEERLFELDIVLGGEA